MSDGNGKPWGTIREVAAPKPVVRVSEYEDLYCELALRLEQTRPNKALAVPFPDLETADRVRDALSRLARSRRGPGHVRFRVCAEDEGAVLYAIRGPQWSKSA